MKVFEENRHIFLLQSKITEAKRVNIMLGREMKNQRFNPDNTDDEGWNEPKRMTEEEN